jgi:predicted DNA-binding transcriptional regulator YafY
VLDTSARLLRLLSLLQTRRDWSGPELSDRLEVDVRTVRRDVDRLRDLGYSIRASSGPGGGYQFGAGRQMPPLLLDDDEAVAVTVALRSAAGSHARLEETALRVLVKLDQILPPRLRNRLSALHAVTVSLARRDDALDPALLTSVAAACRDREQLAFGYQDRGGKASRRSIEPLRLAHTGRRWYLVAWDLDRADWRTFRVDRIAAPLTTGARFLPRPFPGDVAHYVSRSITYEPYELRARLRIAGSAAENAQRIPHWAGVLEAVDDGSCILAIGSSSIESLVSTMLCAGVDFTIIDPPEIIPRVREVIARLQRALPAQN